MLASHASQEEIARLVKDADALVVTDADLATLKAAGAGEPLLEALRKRRGRAETFSIDAVTRMVAAGKPAAEIVDRILEEGQRFSLTATETLALVRRGVKDDVLRALEGGYVYSGFTRYLPENRLYEIQHPSAWKAQTFFTADGMRVVLTPQEGMKSADDFSLGVQIDLQPLDPGSTDARRGVLEGLSRSLPALVRMNRGMALEPTADEAGKLRAVRVAGESGATIDFLATMHGERCHDRMVVVAAEGVKFDLEFVAPLEGHAAMTETFARMLRTFRPYPDRVRVQRRAEALDAALAVERYRSAVVQVVYQDEDARHAGSGFIVRSDGYVLTNHHVVCSRDDHNRCRSPADMRLARSIEVVWDKAVGGKSEGQRQRRMPATLVDTVYLEHPHADLALLKLPADGAPYPTIPIGRIGRLERTGLVAGGDPVIAMGFPLSFGAFMPDEVMSTTGVVARLVTEDTLLGTGGRAERLDDVVTTAQIQHGNSGGPCISLRTGSVVGLNTAFAVNRGELLINYFRICPIDEALYAFPQLTYYPFGVDLGPEAHSDLASMLLTAGNTRSAGVELELASAKAPTLGPLAQANLLYRQATYFTQRHDDVRALKALLACIERDPTHSGALSDLASVQDEDHAEVALGYAERLVKAYDDHWWSYERRGEMRRRAKRFDAALEDVKASLERGGASEPSIHRLLGRIRVDMGQCPAASAAYRDAIVEDAADWEAKLGLAGCAVHSGDPVEAMKRFETAVREHRDEPSVREAYGRHLLTQAGREKDGVEQLVLAVDRALARDAIPDPQLLNDLAEAALTQKDVRTARLASVHLHRYWPGWRALTHRLLARMWPEPTHEALVRAHLAADEVLEPSVTGGVEALRVSPLTIEDIVDSIAARYGGSLLTEVLEATNLGFNFAFDPDAMTETALKFVNARGWDPWHVRVIHARYQLDQLKGGRALVDPVEVKWADSVDASQDPPTSSVRLTNSGLVDLTRIRVRFGYLPASGEQPLGELDSDLPSAAPVLRSGGGVLTVPVRLHTAAELRAHGIDPEKVKLFTVSLVTGRNAYYLSNLDVATANAGDGDFEATVTNKSAFAIRDAVIRCALVEGGKPVLDAAGKAVERFGLIEGERIEPGHSTRITLTGWRSAETWQKFGLPEGLKPGMSFAVTGGEALPRTPVAAK